MGTLNPRLARMYQAVNPGTRLPIIITLTEPPNTELIQRLNQTTNTPIQVSNVFNLAFTTADETTAKKLANIPGVKEVTPDEPTHAL